MSQSWSDLFDEIARWRDGGQVVDFWWRDDDACRVTPQLSRLVALAESSAVPLALAVIPHEVDPLVLAPGSAMVHVLQHGADHSNRGRDGEKKTEFAASEPVAVALKRLEKGRWAIDGPRTLPVLVPPWNRVSSGALLDRLAAAGYRGLSRFGARDPGSELAGLVQVNTHVDLIDWRGTRGFVGEDIALGSAVAHLQARRLGSADGKEATGWLTHHLVHDEACWNFLALLFERTAPVGGVAWHGADALFSAKLLPSS